MLNIEGEGCINVMFEVVQRLVWKTIHEVDTDIPYSCVAKPLHGHWHLCRCVATMEKTQALVVKRLCTHGDAVDAEAL